MDKGFYIRAGLYAIVSIAGIAFVALGLVDANTANGWLLSVAGVTSAVGGATAAKNLHRKPPEDDSEINSLNDIRKMLGE